MVGKLMKDKESWWIIHEEAAGPYVWVTPYKIDPDQEIPEDWKEGDIIEFNLDGPRFETFTISNNLYLTAKIDFVL